MVVWEHTSKRKVALQYSALIAGVVLVSQLALHDLSLGKLATNVYENLAAVAAMTASVAPNPENTLAVQFAQKERELSEREQTLLAKENDFDAKYRDAIASNRRMTLFVLGGITLLLLLLILLNFYFDVKREEAHEKELSGVPHSEHEGELTTKL